MDIFSKFFTQLYTKFIKRILRSIQKVVMSVFRGDANWMVIVGIIIFIILVILAIYLYRKRKKAQIPPGKEQTPDGGKDTKDTAVQKPPEESLPVTRLLQVWKEFMAEIPREFRRTIMVYQHFIVMGETGSGKSILIDKLTDWKRQSRQFYPSYISNSLLQIYLGSMIVIQELPGTIIHDISKNTRDALIKLWKPLFKRKDPTVVITLNVASLHSNDTEYLKKEAQMLRGKINVLSGIRNRPIKVCIAVTHMDQLKGFVEFSGFLSHQKKPLKLEFKSKEDLGNITNCLDPYENYLTSSITAITADNYLKSISFLRSTPKILQALATFIEILQTPDPLSSEPNVESLCFSCQADNYVPVSNPFTTTLSAADIKKFNPNLKHQIAAAVLTVAGVAYIAFGFYHERQLVKTRYQELITFEHSPPLRYDKKIHNLLIDPIASMQQNIFVPFMPDFFPNTNRQVSTRFIEDIRKFYLLPKLENYLEYGTVAGEYTDRAAKRISGVTEIIQQGGVTQEETIYLLSLIYATKDNSLGKLIKENKVLWTTLLNLPEILIDDYLSYNETYAELPLGIDKITFQQNTGIAVDPHRLMSHFQKLNNLMKQSIISKGEFQKIVSESSSILNKLLNIENYGFLEKVTNLLKKESPMDLAIDLFVKKDNQARQKQIRDLLQLIEGSELSYRQVTDELTLADFHQYLDVLLQFGKINNKETEQRYNFQFANQQFKFNARDWNDLLLRSKITYLLRDFIAANKRHDGLIFFADKKEFSDIFLNPANNGNFLFSGQAKIDGIFTKDAFEKRVKPVVEKIPDFIESLPIQDQDKNEFSNFLFQEIVSYSQEYADQYINYFQSFGIIIKSTGAMRYVLNHLTLPSSQLMDVLLTVRDNTALELNNNKYLKPLGLKLAEFDCFQRLMEERKGEFPELENYKNILTMMRDDLGAEQTSADTKDEKDPTAAIKSYLSPLGRMNIAVFSEDENSYAHMITMWLDSIGIPSKWRQVFLAPVNQAYLLGIPELEGMINKVWRELWRTDIDPLYKKFPFNRRSGTDISMQDLEKILHPTGHFWHNFDAMIAPFCIKSDNTWQRRPSSLKTPRFPDKMLTVVNSLARITSNLWDKDGVAQALKIRLKPALLPTIQNSDSIPILSYLKLGDTTVFGFNQYSSWKDVNYEWFNETEASVGVEFTDKKDSAKFRTAASVSSSVWSFYHMLQMGEKAERGLKFIQKTNNHDSAAGEIYKWQVRTPGQQSKLLGISIPWSEIVYKKLSVKFAFEGDPWAFFSLPPLGQVDIKDFDELLCPDDK